ncbi:ATP-binding cassette sub-family G member 4-like [Bradysia coprophila]|uniref:ATP-binding cassette sub-family G member 4-like n=1 Tax=Bradysia coprophila TaxID=38358 RepID=UPI00187D9A73|nr:ATP-binding cassette sub-family G member 4-like [Bradysia coprophila]
MSQLLADDSIALVWEGLCYEDAPSFLEEITAKCRSFKTKKRRQILNELNGYLKFGELTALMGPSGAGKSTLLNCLTQGESYEGTDGRIAVAKAEMRSVFITQNERDHLLFNLTVFESMYYASEMKNPPSTTTSQHIAIVKRLLDDLDLEKVENVMIAQCSGGQKKRIAIALELTAITKPNFVFLDEPTSGLDSHSGFNVIHRLRILSQQLNIAVVTVIHQPNFEIFSQFHNVYILSNVGRCIFTGSPKTLQERLTAYNYQISNSNPADVIIFVASCISEEDEEDLVEPMHASVEEISYKKLEDAQRDCEEMIKQVAEDWPKNLLTLSGIEIEKYGLCTSPESFRMHTLWVLMKRTFITSLLRQKRLILIRLALHLLVAVVLAALYNRSLGKTGDCYVVVHNSTSLCKSENIEHNLRKESDPGQNVKFQFFSLLFLMFAALMPTVLTFPVEIKLFINEHRNGWYNTSFYYISKTLIEIPVQLLFSFCFVYFLYWYSEQIDVTWRFNCFLAVTIVSGFIAQGFGFLIGVLCVNSFSMAIILSSTVLLFQFLFSGFFVKILQMSVYTKWVTYFSFVRFSFESLLIILYGENRCQSPSKSSIMYTFDLHDDNLISNTFWIACHLIATRLLAYLLLRNLADEAMLSRTLSWEVVSQSITTRYKHVRQRFRFGRSNSNYQREYHL